MAGRERKAPRLGGISRGKSNEGKRESANCKP